MHTNYQCLARPRPTLPREGVVVTPPCVAGIEGWGICVVLYQSGRSMKACQRSRLVMVCPRGVSSWKCIYFHLNCTQDRVAATM